MAKLKRLAAAAVFSATLFGTMSPANAAWEIDASEDVEAGIFHDVAYVHALGGNAMLEVGCYYEEPDYIELYFIVFTGEDYDRTASYAAHVPVTFTVDGKAVGLSAQFQDIEGELVVAGGEYEGDNEEVLFDTLVAIEGSVTPTEIAFFQTRLAFPAGNAERAVGFVIDSCL